MIELSHRYHLDQSISNFRGSRCSFSFLFHLSMKFLLANSIAPDEMPHFAVSYLGLYCLPMSKTWDARLRLKKTSASI